MNKKPCSLRSGDYARIQKILQEKNLHILVLIDVFRSFPPNVFSCRSVKDLVVKYYQDLPKEKAFLSQLPKDFFIKLIEVCDEKDDDFLQLLLNLWDRSLYSVHQDFESYKKHFVKHLSSQGVIFDVKDMYYLHFSPAQEKFLIHAFNRLRSVVETKKDLIDMYHGGGILFAKHPTLVYEPDNGGILMSEELASTVPSLAPYFKIEFPYLEEIQKRSLVMLAEKKYSV